MTENLQPDPKRAIAFLSWLTQGAPLHLERMNSVGPEIPLQKTYGPHELGSAEKFIAMNNGDEYQRNNYFLPNGEFLTGKRAKANLSAVRILHCDLDGKDYPGSPAEQLDTILGLLTDPKRMPKNVPRSRFPANGLVHRHAPGRALETALGKCGPAGAHLASADNQERRSPAFAAVGISG